MVCQFCKTKEATVHVTEIADNKVKKVDACATCAKEKNYNDPAAFAIADHLLGLGAAQKMEEASEAVGALSCDQCGYTQADFKKSLQQPSAEPAAPTIQIPGPAPAIITSPEVKIK